MGKSKADASKGTPNKPSEPPQRSFGQKWRPRLLAAGLLGSLAYGARHAMRIPMGELNTFAGEPLKSTFTGMRPIDELLSRLVSAFSYPLYGEDPAARVQLMYFAPLLGAAAMTWIVEGYRRDNKTSTFLAACQIFGVGLVAPLYFLLSIMADKGDIVSQSVPLEVGKAILPAFIVGYVLPTVMMFVPLGDISATQNMVAFWQPSPIYAAALTAIIAAFIRRARTNKTKSKSKTVRKTAESVSGPLKSAYAFAFVQFALAHVSLIGYIMSHPGLSLNHVFLDLPHPFGEWDLSDPTRAIFIFMKFDMLFYVLSVLVYLLYNIWDLMKLGCVSTQDATRATVATFAGQVLVGPGATYVGVWRWREEALTKLKS